MACGEEEAQNSNLFGNFRA